MVQAVLKDDDGGEHRLAAATLGRKVVVITVDPARRLGDALGLDSGLSDLPKWCFPMMSLASCGQ